MSKKTMAERTGKFDCVEMKRRIQENIYEETRGMKPDEFLAYMHKQVQESRFAAFFARPDNVTSASDLSPFGPVTAPLRAAEGKAEYTAAPPDRGQGH